MKIGQILLTSLLGLGALGTASAKTIHINSFPIDITVPTHAVFADSYKFSIGSNTDLEFSWSSKNQIFLEVLLLQKTGKTYTVDYASSSLSGSFTSDLSHGNYVLDFLGARSGPHSSYTFSVMAVPEADTWAMLILGGGLIGYQLRRKHRSLPRQPISVA